MPTEWTDKVGSKVTQSLLRSSLAMFLSVLRLRVIYSPFYQLLRKPTGPLVVWVYQKLRQPAPLPGPASRAGRCKQPAPAGKTELVSK